jgi:hypothetical protein
MQLLGFNLFFLTHLLLLTMAWHFTMELPAHLSECFLSLKFLASLIEVFELYSIIILILSCSEFLELILNRNLFIATYGLNLSKHAALSEVLKCESDSYIYF